jgi:hypothetical protein
MHLSMRQFSLLPRSSQVAYLESKGILPGSPVQPEDIVITLTGLDGDWSMADLDAVHDHISYINEKIAELHLAWADAHLEDYHHLMRLYEAA